MSWPAYLTPQLARGFAGVTLDEAKSFKELVKPSSAL